jgi:hypothetical protein
MKKKTLIEEFKMDKAKFWTLVIMGIFISFEWEVRRVARKRVRGALKSFFK